MSAQDKFDEIAEEASGKASKVPCSIEEYQNGLQTIIEFLQGDLRASKME